MHLTRPQTQTEIKTTAGAIRIRETSDGSCGQTHVGTLYVMDSRGIEPYSYSALIDLECDATVPDDECTEQISLVYGRTTFQSPIVSSLLNNTAGDNDDNQLQPPNEEAGGTDAWFYSTVLPIGIGSAVAGIVAFVMFKRL